MATKIYMGIAPDGAFPEDYFPEVPAAAVSGDVITEICMAVNSYVCTEVR